MQKKTAHTTRPIRSYTLPARQKLAFLQNLSMLFRSGIPVLEALEYLTLEADKKLKQVIVEVAADLREGHALSESFSRFPLIFDQVTLSTIHAGEQSGKLDVVIAQAAQKIKRDISFSEKIKNAAIYPLFVMFLFAGVLTMILFYVIPRISKVFNSLHVQLPFVTKIVFSTSGFLVEHVVLVIGLSCITIGILLFLFQREKKALMSFLSTLPGIAPLVRDIDYQRFTANLALVLQSGIPVVDALEYVSSIVKVQKIQNAVRHARTAVLNGNTLAVGMRESQNAFSPLLLQLIEAGEKSGNLAESLAELAVEYEERVDTRLKNLTALLEPILLVVVGLLVGALMISIIAPIYQLLGSITPN